MICIADSGSTKTDWVIVDDDGNITSRFTTKGLNPNLISPEIILTELKSAPELHAAVPSRKVFFYGSGCGTKQNAEMMRGTLQQFFSGAAIEVQSDLWASVRALCGNKSGIACILGTGSNACFFDGNHIHGEAMSLGYVLGDEGSGYVLGKRLVRDYFYRLLPDDLHEKFVAAYQLTRDELLQQLYNKPTPNQYLASFVPFIKEHIDHPYCAYLVDHGFEEFLKIFVWRFSNYKLWPTHFSGSVAFHFQDELKSKCKKLQIIPGKIIASPIDELVAYHIAMEK